MLTSNPLSIVRYAARLLPKRDRRLLLAASIFQVCLSFLDLAGVALVGVLGSLSVNGVQSKAPGAKVETVLQLFSLDGKTFQFQVAIIGILAATTLISRTVLSVVFSRRTMYFLSRRGANISSDLVSRLLNDSYLNVSSKTTQETIFALTSGVTVLTLVVIAGFINLLSDISLLLVLTLGLVFVDVTLSLATLFLFIGVASLLYFSLHQRIQSLGHKQSELSIQVNEDVAEVLQSFRENIVRGRKSFYAKRISERQVKLASVQAELAFMPNISKYVIESSLVLGTLLICAMQFKLQDATHAVSTLAIFLAAGSRIAPATLRIQQSALAFKNARGNAAPTIRLIDALRNVKPVSELPQALNFDYKGFIPEIEFKSVELTYPTSNTPALTGLNFKICSGETIAIVGPSGAGKTSLVDVMLGVLDPTKGQVRISEMSPDEVISKWPGAIAYVPQDVSILSKTLLENITMGYEAKDIDNVALHEAVEAAQLSDWIKDLPNGFETQAGERGINISGGQRQRVGIARALYTRPKLLVLDEATSALDGQTEADISNSIQALKGKLTVILIAHRLSTVLHADRIYYVNEGKIVDSGTFDELRIRVPDFAVQAHLMGI
jgi:ABC-type multidrug transport system fused ATPase/permease subunit